AGTISFMMDCDTAGVEPDFSLVKSKQLVGGGEITRVNKSVPMALDKLGYAPTEVEEIVAFVDERNTVVGAPFVKAEHYPVFDCAVGDRAIHYTGHTKMMGAVQPFISGAISKTVNLPETVSVDEVAKLFVDSWKLGVKAIAIYRDHCKVAQPLSGKQDCGAAKALVDYIFRWMGKKFLTVDQQEEIGILSAEVRARLAEGYRNGGDAPASVAAPVEMAPPGQTALFNAFEDAQECAKCGGRMVRTGSCYTWRDCGTNTGCS